ncbi:NAD-dependent histone deacetylase sir2 [Coemansia biformis]|uniref:NAD-dependent histone deacetylase sir2 n=1 Tax=Coemansia biformis TaxID=1286918 RepID=A0A9W7Y9B1_9FUNG|nr:NAD-dependent histone deacetylase sir2 [Coemansia biformis]
MDQLADGSDESDDEDYADGAAASSDDEDLNIDGSYAASPLGADAESARPYARFTDEAAAAVRKDAYTLGVAGFLHEYVVERGTSVRALLEVFSAPVFLGSGVQDLQLLPLLRNQLVRFFRNRPKLAHVNTVEDVVDLLSKSRRILVLTGAGVSVSCGIPDFRSPAGIYTRLNEEFGLDDPQQMFDIEYFRETPELFYSFARELYPYNFKPAPSHAFIHLLEEKGKLLRNYTQNIDTLEHVQGIKGVLNCHGSFATATCIKCGYKCDGTELESDIMAKRIAYCPQCNDRPKTRSEAAAGEPGTAALLGGRVVDANVGDFNSGEDDDDEDDDDDYGVVRGIMKPDITFFGEKLPRQFDEALLADRTEVDLLLVMGSSLKVAPVSDIMSHLPHNVPQIVINKTPILHFNFDVQLLGNADDIVAYLARRCGWELKHPRVPGGSTESSEFGGAVPVDKPISMTLPIEKADGDNNGGSSSGSGGEKVLDVPSHWHLFPSAIVTVKDLLVANGKSGVQLALDSSDEDDDSELSGTDDSSCNDDDDGCGDGPTNAANGNASDSSEHLAQDISRAVV